MTSRSIDISHVRPHLSLIALTQLPCLLLAALMLDGGRTLRMCIIAVFAHWLAIALISARDRSEIAATDGFIIRWGFFPILLGVKLIGYATW